MDPSSVNPRDQPATTPFRRDEELFSGAVSLPAEERFHYLRRACGQDVAAFNRLSTLIDAFDDSAAFFADSAVADAGELEISQEHRTEKSATYAKLLLNLGRVQLLAGKLKEARTNFVQSIALGRELGGAMNPEVASALLELSRAFMWSDDLPAAERAIREALVIFDATRPPGHPDLVLGAQRLGEVLMLKGRIDEAAPLFERTLFGQAKLYGYNSVQVAEVLGSLASIRHTQGRLQAAEELGRRALDTRLKALGHEDTNTGFLHSQLAVILTKRGKYDEAERALREALAIHERTLPPDHQYVAAAEHWLGEVLLATGRLRDAEASLVAATNRWKRTNAGAWRIARSQSALGEAIYRQGRAAKAERYLVDSFRVLVADESADREARIRAQQRITRFYTDRGERSKLEELLLVTSEAHKTQEDSRLGPR
jgi:eukaryotic-like serine/threonine-protein kinase